MWWLRAFAVAVNFPAFSPSQALGKGDSTRAARLWGVASRPRCGGLTDEGDHHDYRKISERRKRPDCRRARCSAWARDALISAEQQRRGLHRRDRNRL